MRLSKQHKMYGAVLGLALAALGADRLMSTPTPAEPAEAYAVTKQAAPATAAPAKRTVAKAANAPAATVDDRRAISAKLDELAHGAGLPMGETRDAFVPPAAWVGSPVAVAAGASDEERARLAAEEKVRSAARERARKFVADHRLSAVMDGTGRNAVAVVDGKPMRPGQTLDGFKLVSVSGHESKAVFETGGGGETIELRLTKTTTPAPAATVAQAN